jgi:dUTP pyrophosphatase
MRVRIRRLADDVELPIYHSPGAAAFDLTANQDATVSPGEVRLIGTGIVVQVPEGFFLAIVARSSLPLRKGLIVANGVGVVDCDYCGPEDEVKVQVCNLTSAPVQVRRGDRIAQGLLLPAVRIEWDEVEDHGSPSRGGFGATGGYS